MNPMPPDGGKGQQDRTKTFLFRKLKVRRSPPFPLGNPWQTLPKQCAMPTMAFFDSDIVQDEAKRLFSDYQQLMQLGSEYGKFDREGKKKFIETMEELMGRYRVFMKRFELSELSLIHISEPTRPY